MFRSGGRPGCDQASQRESGEKASPVTSLGASSTTVVTPSRAARAVAGEVDDEQPAVVRRDRGEPPVGRAGELEHPPEPAGREPPRRCRTVGGPDLERVVALRRR